MTIRKTLPSAHTSAATRGLVLSALMVSLTGCGMLSSVIEADKVDYKLSKKAATLDVPPDLTQLQRDNRYSVPDNARGTATASGYSAQSADAAAGAAAGTVPVGAAANSFMHIERAGDKRWLVVRQTPEQLWPVLKSFWEDNGLAIVVDTPAAGIMETDWAENRAKIPQDFIRNSIGKVIDGLYATGQRDKYRTRLERMPDGSTEVYISHRGTEEVLTGAQKESIIWANRANDPTLEAQFLTKLMGRLGGDQVKAKAIVADAVAQPLHAKLLGTGASKHLELDEGFDRAWRRVGLGLDRVGFTVEDRDRVQGVYFVRFVDADAAKADGFFTKLMNITSSSDKAKEAQRYRITVKAAEAGATSDVAVQSNDGKPEVSVTSDKILTLLLEQLK